MEYLTIGVRSLLGVVFLVSSCSKVIGDGAFATFTAGVRDLRLAPPRLTGLMARAVVAAEFAVWLLLAFPARWGHLVGLAVAEGLLIAFTLGVAVSVRRGVREPCRCFGVSPAPLGPRHVVRNALLAVLPAVGMVTALAADGPTQAGWVAIALLGGLLLGGLVVMLDDLLDLFQRVDAGPAAARGRR